MSNKSSAQGESLRCLLNSASRKAVDLAPKLAEVHASRGVALSTLRNYPDAEEEFRAAIRLDPSLYEAHYFYGLACLAPLVGSILTFWSSSIAPEVIWPFK